MTDQTLANNGATEAPASDAETQAAAEKTYTQKELDGMMARMRSKYERQYSDLGDIDELRQLKTDAERLKESEAIRRGEFEKILQEKAAKWETEVQKRDTVIKEYRVNTPLVNAAAKFRSVNPEQVKALLASNVRLNTDGEPEVVDGTGAVRYNDNGTPFAVENLVKEFLDANPHFVMPGSATTNTKSNAGATISAVFDITKLDMRNPEHRNQYAQAKRQGKI